MAISDLAEFLEESGVELSDILRRGSHSWTRLRRDAGLPTAPGSELEERAARAGAAFAHVDDRDRADGLRRLLADDAPAYDELSPDEQRLARMLFYSLWSDGGGHASYDAGLTALRREPAVRREISCRGRLSFEAARHVAARARRSPASTSRCGCTLATNARRSSQPSTSLETPTVSGKVSGTHRISTSTPSSSRSRSPKRTTRRPRCTATTRSRRRCSTGSRSRQRQSHSKTGQRYLSGSSRVLIFARHEQKDEFGTSPYLFLGPAHYVSHTGDRPIAITWKLDHDDAHGLLHSRLGGRTVGQRRGVGDREARTTDQAA